MPKMELSAPAPLGLLGLIFVALICFDTRPVHSEPAVPSGTGGELGGFGFLVSGGMLMYTNTFFSLLHSLSMRVKRYSSLGTMYLPLQRRGHLFIQLVNLSFQTMTFLGQTQLGPYTRSTRALTCTVNLTWKLAWLRLTLKAL